MCHRMPYFGGACTGAPQNSYFCGEDSVAYHPCATEYEYWCATDEVFPTSDGELSGRSGGALGPGMDARRSLSGARMWGLQGQKGGGSTTACG
jgi:hypothetical protein